MLLAPSESLSIEEASLLSSLSSFKLCSSGGGVDIAVMLGFSRPRGCAGVTAGCTPLQAPGKPWIRVVKPAEVLCDRGRKGAAPGFSFGGSRLMAGSWGFFGLCPLLLCHSSASLCSLLPSACKNDSSVRVALNPLLSLHARTCGTQPEAQIQLKKLKP